MTRSIPSIPHPSRTSAPPQAEKASGRRPDTQSARPGDAAPFTRDRLSSQAERVSADQNPVGWVRQHIGQPLMSAAHSTRQFGHNLRERFNGQPARVEAPVFNGPLGSPLAPIANLHPGDSPHRAPGVMTYMNGWSRTGLTFYQMARVYAPQPYPPGVFPVGVDPNDPLITHF